MHVSQTINLLKYKIPCFIEKPLGSSLSRLKELQKLFIQKNIITMMGFQHRFNPLIKFLEKTNFFLQTKNQFNHQINKLNNFFSIKKENKVILFSKKYDIC